MRCARDGLPRPRPPARLCSRARLPRPAHPGLCALCPQGINGDSTAFGRQNDDALGWLWEQVDALTPSIYPRYGLDDAGLAAMTNSTVREAIRIADRVASRRAAASDPRPAPAVYPYARALVDWQSGESGPITPMSRGQLAAGIQVAAGLGAEGVALWGSTEDYSCAAGGCAQVKKVLDATAGPLVRQCVANREACAAARCGGRGRCVDYTADRLVETCLSDAPAVACRCDAGFEGVRCEVKR